MRLGVDVVAANASVRTGAGEYTFRLLSAMMQEPSPFEEVLLYTPTPLHEGWPELPSGWRVVVLPWKLPAFASVRLQWELLRHPPDVFWAPSSSVAALSPGFSRKRHPQVTTLHDVGFLRLPRVYAPSDRKRQTRLFWRAIKKSAKLFSISKTTTKEVLTYAKVNEARVIEAPLAVAPEWGVASLVDVEAVRRKYHLSRSYFVFVSRVDAKKNVEGLVRAFTLFKEGRGVGDPYQLVIVGPPGFGYDQIKKGIEASSVRDAIVVTGAVSEGEKRALYTGAVGYVNVSWEEGFGLTPLEAAACGVPSLLSDIPAHREVMGEGALYVRPDAVDRIAESWKRFAEDSRLRETLLVQAKDRLKAFSWQKTARVVWEGLASTVSTSKK